MFVKEKCLINPNFFGGSVRFFGDDLVIVKPKPVTSNLSLLLYHHL